MLGVALAAFLPTLLMGKKGDKGASLTGADDEMPTLFLPREEDGSPDRSHGMRTRSQREKDE